MILDNETKIFEILKTLYGEKKADKYFLQVMNKIEYLKTFKKNSRGNNLNEKDTILITYGDSLYNKEKEEKTLVTLHKFLSKYLSSYINTVHILPFFPYTSDDGFSIVDYKKVNEKLGSWKDIEALNKDFNLMFDLVANHVSKSSKWFEFFLEGKEPYNNYFITCDKDKDYTKVFRPRALPLLTKVEAKDGGKYVWSTFSSDQIDLNYQSPDLLMEILDVFSFYVEKGASFIRLDAIAFIWKEIGTTCIHNKQTHLIIQLIRLMIECAKIDVKIITETNVPHKENISYFGNGYNEASMVYNFPLPPLTLYTFLKSDATVIKKWAASLELPSDKVTFFNFLASHDGIGLLPAKGLVDDSDVKLMAQKVQELGGFVSYKMEEDGNKSPYEMNINFFDALKISGEVNQDLEVKRFLASQSILLSLKGVPGIYIHSLIGSRNWIEGVKLQNSNRAINREKIELNHLEEKINDPTSLRNHILNGYKELLNLRINNKCFSPKANQKIIENIDKRVFALERYHENESVLCLTNVSCDKVETRFKDYETLNGTPFNGTLDPYQVAWLKK
ncbi:MAG: alpha-amylase family glycosyl hydrolase [Sphaerochaetaceae bacterium]|nr:alpha-amylase family glycosyl hydrolase [Sphaerochaetaceae bacterium]